MSNPFLDLQEATAARIIARPSLANIPVITETLGDVVNRLERSLIKGGVKGNEQGKSGCAMIVYTPKGVGVEGTRTVSEQNITVRVEIYFKILINNSANGLQKVPLQVLWDVICQVISWNTGPGQSPNELLNYGVLENTAQELNYFADFNVNKTLTIETA